MKARWLIGGSVYSVVVLLIGTAVVSMQISQHASETTSSHQHVSRLLIDAPHGTVTVRRGGPAVTVHRRLAAAWGWPSTNDRQTGETLILRADCGDGPGVHVSANCEVDYEIEAPPDVDVTASASGISVTGLLGALDLTADGPITVTGSPGALTVRSTNGPVDIRR